MHPEVILSFLTLLYAGKTLKYINTVGNPKGFPIVTILYIWVNQQVKKYHYMYFWTSETLRNDIILYSTSVGFPKGEEDYLIKLWFPSVITIYNFIIHIYKCSKIGLFLYYKKIISEHSITHYKPLNETQLGYYLAGLIDGDGNFSNQKGYLTITYNLKDISSAYWLKSQIGYGSVTKIKDKKAIKYVVSHSEGLLKILILINGKLRLYNKYQQITNYLLIKNQLVKNKFYNQHEKFTLDSSDNFDNHWLAGFIDADGSFQIKLIKKSTCHNLTPSRWECRLKLQIAQKDKKILEKIRLFLCNINKKSNLQYHFEQDNLPVKIKGCYIGTRLHNKEELSENNTTYYLETTSFEIAKNLINYLDKYHLISYKYLNYLFFRKAYLLIQSKKHLTEEGMNKIKNYKLKMKY